MRDKWPSMPYDIVNIRGMGYLIVGMLAISIPAATHADELPDWMRSLFVFYADGMISDAELIGALEYLVATGVISVSDQDGKIEDNGDFYLVYGLNPNIPADESAAGWLQSSGLLEAEVEWLNENFRLPYDVEIRAVECGQPNAFYYREEAAVEICYEYVSDLFDKWDRYNELEDGGEDSAHTFAYDNTLATLYHELGHAFIDVYDLPYTGLEENVADQFEALMLLEFDVGQDMMNHVADSWNYAIMDSEERGGEHMYWDTHGLDRQRLYNTLCYMYGADPDSNQYLIEEDHLPEERAKWCEEEYRHMDRAWRHLLQDYTNGFMDLDMSP